MIQKCIQNKTYSNKGLALMTIKKHEKAIDCFNKAIELNPNNLDAYNGKRCILKNLNKYEEALRKLKNYQEAIQCYNKAIELSKF
jgi:tetratricopeptide (TPR) repeat protein